MNLFLKDGTVVKVSSVTESTRTTPDNSHKREFSASIVSDLTYDELMNIFTKENISDMSLEFFDMKKIKKVFVYHESGEVYIDISVSSSGEIHRTVTIS